MGVPERVNVRGKGCGMQPFCFYRVRACNLALKYLIDDTFPMSTTPALAWFTDIAGCPGLPQIVAVAVAVAVARPVSHRSSMRPLRDGAAGCPCCRTQEAAPIMPATMPRNEALVSQLRAKLRESS